MKKIIKLQSVGIILFSMLFTMSCSDDNNSPSTSVLNIEEAKLLDFPLFAIEPIGIEIVQPEIVDNKEVTYGEIKITLPSTITSLENISASITSNELNLSKFSISPSNSVSLSFEDGKIHVFTISTATGDQEALLHYNVSIIKEIPPVPETLKITGFTFEKSKNPSLPNDITITKTVVDDGGIDKIYLFVPLGTDFTDLVPTIIYDGTKLYYTQENNLNTNVEYPNVDTSFDFKYPKPFYLTVKNRDDDEQKTTTVIVDVVNPVRIERESVTTPDATEGTSEYFTGVTKWVNQGNHKINFQKATTYEDVDPVGGTTFKAITVDRDLPSGGLLPGESANVNVQVSSQHYPEGTYKSTAVFYTRIYHDFDSDDLFEPVKVAVTSNIIK